MPKIDWDKAESYEPPMVEIRPFEEREVEVAFDTDAGEQDTTEMLFPTVMLSDASRLKVKVGKQKPPIAFLEDMRDDGGLKRALTPAREAEFREWLQTSRHLLTIQQAGYAILATTDGEILGFNIEFPNANNIPNEADDESWTLLYHWAKDEHPGASPAWIWKHLQSMREQGVSAVSLDSDGGTPWVPTKEQLFEEFTASRFMDAARVAWAKQAGAPEWLKLNGIEEPAEELEQLFKQDAARLHRHTVPVTKVSQELTTFKPNRKNSVNVGTAKNPIGVSISFEYEGEGLSLKRHLSEYDQAVSNAWLALWYEGARVVTDRQIFQAMTGTTSKVTEKQVQTVGESMDKCRDTDTIIDFSAEVRGREIQDGDTRITTETAYREGKLINADVVTAIGKNGEKVKAYVANGEPILGWYARVTGKLPTIPQRLLTETAGAVSLTPNNIALRSYLLRRIESMKRNPKLSKSIKYDTMQLRVYGSEQSATERTRNKSAALKLLTAFKEAGHIADATEYCRNENGHRRTIGVKIELTDKEQKKPSSRKRH